VIILLGLALYVVTAISLPKEMTADVTPAVASVGAPNAPPTTLALSRGGSLGVIVQPTSTSGAAELKLLVIRGGDRFDLRGNSGTTSVPGNEKTAV